MHWPIPSRDRYVDTYRALERIRREGRARSIGVSNFAIEHLERLLGETEVVPVINQVELHPRLPQEELRAFDAEHGIVTQAWSPLARGRLLDEPVLASIAAKHGVSPAQVVLRWHVQHGVVVIPKSVTPARIGRTSTCSASPSTRRIWQESAHSRPASAPDATRAWTDAP